MGTGATLSIVACTSNAGPSGPLPKGTVSPDIGLNFSVWKIKSVLSVRPLMVFTFFYFVAH